MIEKSSDLVCQKVNSTLNRGLVSTKYAKKLYNFDRWSGTIIIYALIGLTPWMLATILHFSPWSSDLVVALIVILYIIGALTMAGAISCMNDMIQEVSCWRTDDRICTNVEILLEPEWLKSNLTDDEILILLNVYDAFADGKMRCEHWYRLDMVSRWIDLLDVHNGDNKRNLVSASESIRSLISSS